MKILVAGYGLIGKQRVAAFQQAREVDDIAVIDPALRAAPAGSKIRLLALEDVGRERFDGIVIATPHDIAAQLAVDLAPQATAMLIEKPLGRSGSEARKIVAAVTAAGCRLSVGFNYRFLKNVQRLAVIVRSGEYGRVIGVDAVLAHGAAPDYERSWKVDRTRAGGGVCIDPGVHVLDLLRWLLGPLTLSGGLLGRSYWPIDAEDHAALTLSFGNGAIANVYLSIASWQSRFEITVELEGAQLMLRGRGKFYGSQRLTVVTKWPWLKPDAPREISWDDGGEDSSLLVESVQFLSTIGNRDAETDLASADEAVEVMDLVDAAYRLASPASAHTTGHP